MNIYTLEQQQDGSVKILSELSPEEMKFLLEFAVLTLTGFGFVPKSLAKHLDDPDIAQKTFLQEVPTDKIPQA